MSEFLALLCCCPTSIDALSLVFVQARCRLCYFSYTLGSTRCCDGLHQRTCCHVGRWICRGVGTRPLHSCVYCRICHILTQSDIMSQHHWSHLGRRCPQLLPRSKPSSSMRGTALPFVMSSFTKCMSICSLSGLFELIVNHRHIWSVSPWKLRDVKRVDSRM